MSRQADKEGEAIYEGKTATFRLPTTTRTFAHGLWAIVKAAYLIAIALQFSGSISDYLPPPKVACRKAFGHLVTIVADFFRKLFLFNERRALLAVDQKCRCETYSDKAVILYGIQRQGLQ